MNPEERFALISQVASGGEIIGAEELKELLKEKAHPVAYDGFEPSGKIHIAQGLLRVINVNKLTKAGVKFKFWVADWFGLMNNKMGGDLEKIRTVGEYFIEVWKAAGMDTKNVEFIWASELMDQKYWLSVIRIGMLNSVTRITRCAQIMGRSEKDALSAAQIFYPCMQAADIFHLGVDIAQLGMDQRKVNVLAREVAEKLGKKKPIAIHHHMLMGLTEPKSKIPELDAYDVKDKSYVDLNPKTGKFQNIAISLRKSYPQPSIESDLVMLENKLRQVFEADMAFRYRTPVPILPKDIYLSIDELYVSLKKQYFDFRSSAQKMSKSNPDSAIFMTDSTEEINRKFKKAYCPEAQVADNPVLEYCKYIVFELLNGDFVIERPEKFGGNASFSSYADLEAAFVEKKIHPMDLKAATAKYIDSFIEPVREHFKTNKKAKALLEKVESYSVTR